MMLIMLLTAFSTPYAVQDSRNEYVLSKPYKLP